MKLHTLFSVLSPLLLLQSAAYSANVIDSIYGIGAGSFELPDPNIPQYATYPQGSTAIAGWTVGSANIDWVRTTIWNTADGNYSIDLNGTVADGQPPAVGSIKTLVPTTIGTTYQVTFNITSFINFNSPSAVKEMDVVVKSVDLLDLEQPISTTLFQYDAVVHPEPLPFGLTWETRSLTFVATETRTSVAFVSLTTQDHSGMLLDNVVISPVSVPEPTAAVFLFASASGLVLRRRRMPAA